MDNNFSLQGKNAVVVGGAGDLGRAMTEGLAEAQARVVIISRGEKGDALAAELSGKGFDVRNVHADISRTEEVEASFNEALDLLDGRIDILVNCAGVQRRSKCEDFSREDWDYVINVNLTALFQYCQLAGRHMLSIGGGKIINVASMLSYFGGYTVPAYAASKGGVAQLTKALSNEWSGHGINVNAIAPGYMDTAMNVALINDPVRNKEILDRIPAHRWGRPDDLKGVTVFLASNMSDYIDGAIIPVDGGYLGR